MKINLCAEIAKSSSQKNTKGVKSYELRTKSDGTATIGAFCLNCDLCDFNDLYDSDCRNDCSRTIVVDSKSPERATSIAQWQRPVNTRRTRDNQNHKNHTIHKTSIAGIIFSIKLRLFVLLCVLSTPLSAQFFYNETCRNATGAFQYYGDAPGYTANGLGDAPGNGWLRLTDTLKFQNGYVLLDESFPSTMGITIEFDFKIWTKPIGTGGIADGFCVFLFDGDPDSTFKIGQAGANLGYSGMSPAYLGVGIDEYGNFSTAMNSSPDGPGRRRNSIAVRNATYHYVDGTPAYLGTSPDTYLGYTVSTPARPDDATIYRRVRVELKPVTGGMSVSIYLKTSLTGIFDLVIGPVDVIQPTPPLFRLGFNGSTGSYWAYHEVRDVVVRTPGDLSVFKSSKCPAPDNAVIETIIANNVDIETNGISISDTLPAGFVITGGSPTVTNGTMNGFALANTMSDGRKVYSYTVDVPGNSNATVTYNGSFAVLPSSEQFVSSVKMTPPGGFIDNNLNDNQAVNTSYFNLLSATYTTIPVTSAPVTLTVTATNSASVTSYTWEQSLDNGANWTPLASTVTASYIYTGTANAFVRCTALWDTWCRDMVAFHCVTAPDNVDDAECRTIAPPTVWGIRELTMNTTTISNYQQILTGDIDNDGEVEIIAYMDGKSVSGSPAGNYDTNGLRMFVVRNGAVEHKRSWTFKNKSGGNIYAASLATCVIARYNGEAYIVVAATNGYLYAYDYDGVCRWESNQVYTSTGVTNDCVINIADFNGDGIPEVYAGKRIFSITNGSLLCDGSAVGNTVGFLGYNAVADMDGDDMLEIIIGNQIYKVTITNPAGATGNSIALMAGGYQYTGTLPANITGDGRTHVADFDLDGELEVLVVTNTNSKTGAYLWKPNPDGAATLLGSYVAAPTSVSWVGMALVGNIDTDKYPEAVYIANGSSWLMYALKYDPSRPVGSRLVQKWTLSHTDGSGCTGMSLFDFNSDGTNEICYRDETTLRIIDGSGTSATVATGNTFNNVKSGTRIEMPVIADVDGDGQAELIVNGDTNTNGETGYLRVFKSAVGGKWAAARKVWNTYSYRSLNVNDDLTIPAKYINPATRFAGPNGTLGDSDDVFPFNNIYQQQTNIDVNGVPLWTLPRADAGATSYFYNAVKDSMYISIDVVNTGDAPLLTPFYITVYKNALGNATKFTYAWQQHPVAEDATVHITFGIPNYLSSWGDAKQLYIRINDAGNTFNDQKVCDSLSRDKSSGSLLLAINDRAETVGTMPVRIDILTNDSIPTGCTPTLSIVAPLAKYGTATVVNDSVQYIANNNFAGYDTVMYKIVCGSDTSIAVIRIYVAETPDNINDADCYIPAPSLTWSIKMLAQSANEVNHYMIPLAGDIDNDKKVEIIAAANGTTGGGSHNANQLIIYEMNNNVLEKQQTLNLGAYTNNVASNIAIANVDGGPYASIFVATGTIGALPPSTTQQAANLQRKLVKYNFNDATQEYVAQIAPASAPQYSNIAARDAAQPMFADFNNDGIPEVVVLDKVYNARTLTLLADGNILDNTFPTSNYQYGLGYGGHWNNNTSSVTHRTSHMVIADMDNDGIPEVVAGHCVYKVKIATTDGTSGNSFTLWAKCDGTGPGGEAHPEVRDGTTAVADMDKDGFLDVIVTAYATSTTTAGVYIWNPRTRKVMHTTSINNLPATMNNYGPSRALVGDVDGDKQCEIVFLTSTGSSSGRLYCYEFDPVTKTLTEKWPQSNADNSGSTTLTLFDFDNNGSAELVYRDTDKLYILDGATGEAKKSFSGLSNATANEYPLIVDVNNDERAEIVTTGGGMLWVFSSDPVGEWAPARPVWNQVPYNSVNVNDDLTIPRYQLNPATRFPGSDGILGNANDVYPYNNFLQQQTVLSKHGTTLWVTPDVKFTDTPPVFNYYGNGDSLVISSVELTNIGDAALNAPIYISAYKNDAVAANRMSTDSSMVALNADAKDTITINVTIRKFSTYTSLNKIILRINDKGAAKYVQPECDTVANNVFEFNPARFPKAANDTVATLLNTPVFVDVKFNDTLPVCSPVVPIVAVDPSKGVAAIVNDSIRYTPGFYGVDSLVYRLTCNSNDTTYNTDAKVYIIVSKPKSDTYIACKGEKTTAGFESITNVTYHWYKTETGGSPDGSAMDTRSCEAPGVWWVEARYKSKSVRPRLKVTIEEYPELDLTGFSIGNVQTICHGNVPAQLKATGSPSGGDGAYDYQWQQSADGVNGWTDVKDSTNTTLTPPALTSGTYYRLKVASCTTDSSNVVKITVRSSSLYNYPDIRVSVCPDAGASINLSKYIDTLDVSSLSWESVAPHIPISSAIAGSISTGTISADDLNAYTRVYTLAYTVSNPCAANVKRKVYLETVKNGKIRPLRDSIVICHKYAEAIQVNQIFGIDARGTWSFAAYEADGVTPANIDAYIAESQSPEYNGAVIMNGKAIYENTAARKITVTYTPAAGSCVAGRSFTTKIVLTDM